MCGYGHLLQGFKGRLSVSTEFSTEESLISASAVPAANKSPKKRTKANAKEDQTKTKCVCGGWEGGERGGGRGEGGEGER